MVTGRVHGRQATARSCGRPCEPVWLRAVQVLAQLGVAAVVALAGAVLMALVTRRRVGACVWSGVYLALVPFVNWAFAWSPTFELADIGLSGTWTPMTIVTGLVLVFRDLAQREVGRWVLLLLMVGVALTFWTAGGVLAFASGTAFFASELVDFVVYTTSRRPLSQRILLSSTLSAPVDSAVFLYFATLVLPGIFNFWSVLASIAGKLIGAYAVSRLVRRRERRAEAT